MKNIFITGSSKGIGRGLAGYLASNNKLFLNSRSENDLRIEKEKLINDYHAEVEYISGDVTCINDCKKILNYFLDRQVKLDLVIANVGNGSSDEAKMFDHEEWLKVFNLNFFSTLNIILTLLPIMNPTSSIICISSICGLKKVTGAPISYSVAKSSINKLVELIADDLYKFNKIRINTLALGNILFEGSVWNKKLKNNNNNTLEYIKHNVIMNKFGSIDDVFNAVDYLINSKFITGSVHVLDGGQVVK